MLKDGVANKNNVTVNRARAAPWEVILRRLLSGMSIEFLKTLIFAGIYSKQKQKQLINIERKNNFLLHIRSFKNLAKILCVYFVSFNYLINELIEVQQYEKNSKRH